jgi:ribonuclease E
MLINATQEEELRMAMVDGQRLYDLNIELPTGERKKANIYKGKITRLEPSLEAAFVDYGAERHGFLPLKEISPEYFIKPVDSGKFNIRDVLKEGQDIVVQVDKEERGNKGAALTTFVSLAGRFVVLKPNKSQSGGVSRRIVGEDRDQARASLDGVEIPKDMSVILRTAGIDRNPEEIAWDLQNLLTVWTAILNVVLERKSPFLIYRESNSVIRALRDYMTSDVGEILIDDELTYNEAIEFVSQVMPQSQKKIKYYDDPVPLFTRFQVETQIESAFAHSVTLPSGGSIVIDHTEALVSIDINSARSTKGGDIEATALNTNLEAAEEIARQLRIRDLGGLIVIDFIDMGPQKHQRDVENRLRDAVREDRARVQIGKISRFGLLEMSRQRLRPSLDESSYLTCPRCSGIGTIRSVESLALAILRIIGEEARKERTAKVIAQLPAEVATYLLNEKRDWVQSLETRNEVQVVLVANPLLETPHFDVRRIRDDQIDMPENSGVSYALKNPDTEPESPQAILERKAIEPAAIAVLKPSTPAPKPKAERAGFWAWLGSLFAGSGDTNKSSPGNRRSTREIRDGRTRNAPQGRSRSDHRRTDENRKQNRKKAGKAGKKAAARDPNRPQKDADHKPQQQKPQKTQKPLPQDSAAGDTDDAQNTEKKPARSRRSRGGRRRRRGSAADRPPVENSPAQNLSEQEAQAQFARQQIAREADAGKGSAPPEGDSSSSEATTEADAKKTPRPRRKPKTDKPAAESALAAANDTPAPDLADTYPNLQSPAFSDKKPALDQPVKTETSGNGSTEMKPQQKPEIPAAPQPDLPASPQPEAAPARKPEGRLLPWDNEQG